MSDNFKKKPIRYSLFASQGGIAALITIITITLFLFSVGFLVVNLGGTAVFRSQYESQAARAQFIAETGIQDALIRKARDVNYEGSYMLSEDDWELEISVSGTSSAVIIATSSIVGQSVQAQRVIRVEAELDTDGRILSVTKQNL